GLKINRNSERRADFVLPPVSPTNRAALVIKHCHVGPQQMDDLLRFRDERLFVFKQRKNRALDRRHPWMKTQNYARFHFALVVRRLVFRISFTYHREHSSIDACTRLDYMRNKSLFRLVIEILERFAAGFLVL